MDVILLLVGLVTVGALILVVFHWVRRQRESMEEAWTEAARAVGGTVDISTGFLAGTGIGMRANLEGTEVVIGLVGGRFNHTQLSAPAPDAGDLSLSIRRGRVSSVGRALGFQDVEIGDPAFDEAFVVTTNNESLARSWLTPEVRQQVSRVPSYTFSLAHGEVAAVGGGYDGIERDSKVLEAAIRAVAAVASRGRAGVQ
jgi:hypothetical protein